MTIFYIITLNFLMYSLFRFKDYLCYYIMYSISYKDHKTLIFNYYDNVYRNEEIKKIFYNKAIKNKLNNFFTFELKNIHSLASSIEVFKNELENKIVLLDIDLLNEPYQELFTYKEKRFMFRPVAVIDNNNKIQNGMFLKPLFDYTHFHLWKLKKLMSSTIIYDIKISNRKNKNNTKKAKNQLLEKVEPKSFACKQRLENQRLESEAYKQRLESEACKQRLESEAYKQRLENQRLESEAYKQRLEKQRLESEAYKQRLEKQRLESEAFGYTFLKGVVNWKIEIPEEDQEYINNLLVQLYNDNDKFRKILDKSDSLIIWKGLHTDYSQHSNSLHFTAQFLNYDIPDNTCCHFYINSDKIVSITQLINLI